MPANRVYGILSLVPASVKADVVVDYTLDPAIVYANFVQLNLRDDPMLELFSQVRGPELFRMHGLPSWCLELDRPPPINRFEGSNGLASGYHAGFAPPLSERHVVCEASDRNVLRIPGFLIDTVIDNIEAFATPSSSQVGPTAAVAILDWESRTRTLAARTLKDDDKKNRHHCYVLALLAERTLTKNNMYRKFEGDAVQLYEQYLTHLRELAEHGKATARAFDFPMVGAIADRAFIATAQGRIGYARPSVQPGDSVCVSQNSIVPFIVRNRPEGGTRYAYGRGLCEWHHARRSDGDERSA